MTRSQPAFSWDARVYYEDTDAGGIVYYGNYLRFFERARTEWLRSLGVDQQRLAAEQGLQFVVRRAAMDFVAPARLDDLLRVDLAVTRLARTYVELDQEAVRPAGGRIERLCSAKVQVACVRRDSLRPAAIPETIRTSMQR